MTCNNCGQTSDNESNFCKYCGNYLKEFQPDVAINPNPHHTIFGTAYQPQTKSTSDLGYLLIAILIILNGLIWIAWGFFTRIVTSDNQTSFMLIRFVSAFLSIAQFVIMFVFTRRQSYKIVIGIIAALEIIANIYLLTDAFNRFN